jgi:hypothetical protein
MSKKILVTYYSQSGQLERVVKNFAQPFIEARHEVEFLNIQPVTPYTFPWSGASFFDAFPESVLGIATPLQPFSTKHTTYDLIVLAYQPWYLSPSIPVVSLLQTEAFKSLLNNTPVITLIAGRNMWIEAQKKVKAYLQEAGAKLMGNVTLMDRASNLVSAVTIQYWMFTGKKDRFLGIFPKPGVSEQDINSAIQYGQLAASALQNNQLQTLQQQFIESSAVVVKPALQFVESKAIRIFGIWSKLIYGKSNRTFLLKVFKYYLVVALFLVSPIVVLLFYIFIYTLTYRKVKQNQLQALSI